MPALNIWDLMMIIGIAQGMIMAMVLWFKRGLSISAKFLGVIFFVLAFGSFGVFLSQLDLEETSRLYVWAFKYVPFYLYMLIGPSLLFMVQSLADPSFSFRRRQKAHYLAVLYNLIPMMAWVSALIRDLLSLPQYDQEQFITFIYGFLTLGDMGYFFHLAIYTIIARKYLNKRPSPKDRKLHHVVTAFQIFLAVYFPFMIFYLSDYSDVIDAFGYYPVFIPVTILIYWLGFQWFFHLYQSKRTSKPLSIDAQKMAGLLDVEMKSGLFLNPDLSVKMVAQKLGIPQRTLSQYLNQHLKTSFNDYINQLRVEEVKRKLKDSKYEHLTIAAIAHDSGFKSIATFQRAFKHQEGLSPIEFKKNAQITI